MKWKRNKVIYLSILLCILSGVLFLILAKLNKHDVYNDNKVIADTEDYYTAKNLIITPMGDCQWGFSIDKLSGAVTVTSYVVNQNCRLSFTGTVEASTECFKLVLVDITNGTVYTTLYEGSVKQLTNSFMIPEGEYIIKVVGLEAAATGHITITISE